ncbi:unnamed protein product [Anisakis simplex]|uniref:Translocation protein SEC62 n=1 Tax=Anisakis simplex TaxID=6269 RepID=A0A0M3JEG7_ANISI|nr:unnamed protein product [Anisakis simplex]
MVLGTIVGCLFPLWPMWLRQGVYYLSLGGLGCFGVLIGVAIARTILFAIIWATTMGRHKLWILPNLTEDCGFFESFQPWYTYEYCPDGFSSTGAKKKKSDERKKSEERSEAEEEGRDGDSKTGERKGHDASDDSEEGSATETDENDLGSSQVSKEIIF